MFLNKRPIIMCLAKKKKKNLLKVAKLQHSASVHVLLVNIFSKTPAPTEEQINNVFYSNYFTFYIFFRDVP